MTQRRTILVALLGTAFASFSAAASSKLAPDMSGGNHTAPVDVIVQFNSVPSEEHHGRVAQRGGQLRRELRLINAAAYSIPAAALPDLAEDASVSYVSP